MFDGARPESHFLPRKFLEPPQDLLGEIFPWVESELSALEAREQQSPFARDIALHQFLKLLIWFRLLILQDSALLYTKYPQSPLFTYPPFNSPRFRGFAASSVDRIQDVEARGRLSVRNLPQNLVRGFQAAISSLTMAERAARDENRAIMLGLEAQIHALAEHFNQFSGGGTNRQRRSRQAVSPLLPLILVPPALHISHETSLRLGLDTFNEDPTLNPPQYPALSENTASSTFGQPEFPDLSLNVVEEHLTFLAAPGSIVPALGLVGFTPAQLAAWKGLALVYTDARMKRHGWDWLPKTCAEDNRYLDRMGNRTRGATLSVRELNERWNAKWKRDQQTIKSEFSRRKKVIDLIEKLRSKPNWNLELALRFIREVYETDTTFRTTRAFCDRLQAAKSGFFEAVIQRSNTFVH
ncbi:hypothetical protein DFH07DRAFT_1034092 [Mycena maculata]|uniref:Transcription activator GCR1-like domain-containing protein n=1 Tax=Mycena maculata TaxID=230809 RepID=A0AAD7N8Y4_9AGAR|nr:hypothetical protein DFH07DRAFT_1034092 [Mycena maculata]